MAILSPTEDVDVAEQLRRMQMLGQMPNITGMDQTIPGAQDQSPVAPQAPVAPPPQAPRDPTFYGAPVTPPSVAPPPPANPFQAQIDEINKNVKAMGEAGQDVAKLKGQQPTTAQYPVSKLRAALMMPLQILAGAGGRDTSAQYASAIRPGYNKAVSEYQSELDAAQGRLDALRETTKTQLEALKDEGQISKDQQDVLSKQADVDLKRQELELNRQRAKIDEENIAPFNQFLQKSRDEAAANGVPYTREMMLKDIDDYETKFDRARAASERAKWEAERNERETLAKTNRQRITIGQQIATDIKSLEKGIDPLIRAKQNLTGLINAIDDKDAGGAERLINVIQGDMLLTPGIGRGAVRQNMGIIQGMIKAPGFWDTVKGWWQGMTQPGKGSIPDETLQQMRSRAVKMLNAVDDEGKYYEDHLDKLRGIDVDDPAAAREQNNQIMKGFFDGAAGPGPKPSDIPPPSDQKTSPWERTGGKSLDDQIKEQEDKVNKIQESLRKKTGKK